jgi:hypothetical protein
VDQFTAPALARAGASPTVSSTNPSASVRDTTLVVQVLGSGSDDGSQVQLLLNGVPDLEMTTDKVTFVSSSRLDATITIAVDAVPAFRDVAVTTVGGKKGIGTQKFQVWSPS